MVSPFIGIAHNTNRLTTSRYPTTDESPILSLLTFCNTLPNHWQNFSTPIIGHFSHWPFLSLANESLAIFRHKRNPQQTYIRITPTRNPSVIVQTPPCAHIRALHWPITLKYWPMNHWPFSPYRPNYCHWPISNFWLVPVYWQVQKFRLFPIHWPINNNFTDPNIPNSDWDLFLNKQSENFNYTPPHSTEYPPPIIPNKTLDNTSSYLPPRSYQHIPSEFSKPVPTNFHKTFY